MINTIISYFKNLFGIKPAETNKFGVKVTAVETPIVPEYEPAPVKKAKKPRAKKSKN